jgi:MoaA/NifB/PqqE/SkfB family radical SAM enzyme
MLSFLDRRQEMTHTENKSIICPPVIIPEWLVSDSESWAGDIESSLKDCLVRRPPLFASIVVTSRCNSSCLYCPYGKADYLPERRDFDQKALFKVLDKLAAMGTKRVQFAGGEPLLVDWLELLIEHAIDLGLSASLVTNGIALSPKRFHTLQNAGLSALIISFDDVNMDGNQNLRGYPIPESVKWLKAEASDNLWLGANITITVRNQSHIASVAQYLKTFGFTPQVQPLHIFEDSPESILYLPDGNDLKAQVEEWISDPDLLNNSPEYLRHLPTSLDLMDRKPLRCLIPWKHILIDSEGNMSFCCRTDSIGHVMDGVSAVWNGEKAGQVRYETNRGCNRCWLGLVDFWK